jgi:hypothetical protein
MRTALFSILSFLVSFFIFSSEVSAQVPTLDPSQTVNIATGEMQFSLPLGVVKGANGYDFPINLGYKAGIMLNQDASPAGLGFSYGAGGISRKVIFVPDDNVGGAGNYLAENSNPDCATRDWLDFLGMICIAVGILLSVITAGTSLAILGSIGSMIIGVVPTVATSIYFSSIDFSAGGTHNPVYDNTNGQGKGFFNGGSSTDLPDVYFISTPYFSGEMTWVGDPTSGHFVLRSSSGSNQIEKSTVKIDKKIISISGSSLPPKMVFTLTLADGTKLIFNEIDAIPQHEYLTISKYTGKNDCDGMPCYCLANFKCSIKESTIMQWHLTAVLPPDYLDGSTPEDDNPLNSQNKGNWVAFEYSPMEFTHGHMYMGSKQGSELGIATTYLGDGSDDPKYSSAQPVRLCFLRTIRTPNERAEFGYPTPYDRQDRKWTSHIDGTFKPEPRLADVSIYSKTDILRQKVTFSHS